MIEATHAEQRRRLFLAMRDRPEGITSKDFRSPPAIDGGSEIPRVAARIKELRSEHSIPLGLRDDEGYAIYRLSSGPVAQPDPAPVQGPRRLSVAPEPAPIGTHGPGGGLWVHRCGGCLSNHRPGFRCPHGHTMTRIELYAGPVGEPCRKVNVQEERHAA